MALRDILDRGYFPKELPPQFVTTGFAELVCSSASLPPDFEHDIQKEKLKIKALPTKYSLARGGLLRRQLSIPNPVLYYLLCRELHSNWATIQPDIGGTKLSSTHPEFKSAGRAIDSAFPQSARPKLAIRTRLNRRYILTTDINRFYHSIYTHVIPWALHTKAKAKANRKMDLLGNRLDLLVRHGQDGQTVGIPVGPDTSLVLAEIIMQKCDIELLKQMPQIQGHRYIDDYELGFTHRTDAEDAFHILETILARFELALNPKKTKIEELPCLIEDPWAGPLRSFRIREKPDTQENDLIHFFDLSFDLRRTYPDDTVLQYAIGRLLDSDIHHENWPLFQRLLLNCVVPEPAVLPHVVESIISRVIKGNPAKKDDLAEALNSIIIDHSSLGHSSEVAWALTACLALDIMISTEACKELSNCDDSVVGLSALHCEAEGLCDVKLDKTLWSTYMNQEGLYEDHWLLSYEANIKGWLPSRKGADHVSADSNFAFLKSNGVSFYDVKRAKAPFGTVSMPRRRSYWAIYGGYT